MLPIHIVLPTIVTPTKLRRLCGKLGDVKCDDIYHFQFYILAERSSYIILKWIHLSSKCNVLL